MLINLEGHKTYYALCFRFQASNNEAEYEALIAGLHLTRELQTCNLRIYSNSLLVMNLVNDIYLARGERMAAYLEKADGTFLAASIEVILQSKNANTNALAKLASTRDVELLGVVFVEFLAEPSIKRQPKITELT